MRASGKRVKIKFALTLLCVMALAALLGGCDPVLNGTITNHYRFPVEVYEDEGPRYPPTKLGTAAAGGVLHFGIMLRNSHGPYRFYVHKVGGKVIQDVSVPAESFQAPNTLIVGK